jgi:hypothetical protein
MFGKKKEKLFGNKIEPKCEYCANLSDCGPERTCRFGLTCPDCGRFRYEPLKRTPAGAPALKKHDPGEFRL